MAPELDRRAGSWVRRQAPTGGVPIPMPATPTPAGSKRIEQHALADFLIRGELDRHLRRMRARYRGRRDALVDALTQALPEAAVLGVAAGLHVTVQMPDSDNDQAIREEAHHRRVELETMSDYQPASRGRAPALLLGYAQMPEPAIRTGIHLLAEAVRAARTRGDR